MWYGCLQEEKIPLSLVGFELLFLGCPSQQTSYYTDRAIRAFGHSVTEQLTGTYP